MRQKSTVHLAAFLLEKGISLNDFYVIDANCGAVTVRQQQGPFVINSQVQFPYFPIITNFGDHPAGQGLESVILPFVSSITFTPQDSAVSVMPLAFSSENSGVVTPPTYIDINKDWGENDFRDGPQVIAIAAEGPLAGSVDSKLVLIPNGSFAVNGEGQQQQQVNEDNVNFATNAIDWLSDDTGLIDLRTKGITNRPLKQLEDGKKTFTKYGNVILPIALILIIGFVRKQRYNAKKQRWIQGNY